MRLFLDVGNNLGRIDAENPRIRANYVQQERCGGSRLTGRPRGRGTTALVFFAPLTTHARTCITSPSLPVNASPGLRLARSSSQVLGEATLSRL